MAQAWGNVFCENRNAGEEFCTKSRVRCKFFPALYAVLRVASNFGVQAGHSLLFFPLPLTFAAQNRQRLAERKARKAVLNQV